MIKKRVKNIICEDGTKFKLVYSIIENEFETDAGTVPGYGIKIEKYRGDSVEEYAEIPNITVNTIEIYRLFMLLSEHTVTPMCLKEVIDDYLADVFCGS